MLIDSHCSHSGTEFSIKDSSQMDGIKDMVMKKMMIIASSEFKFDISM